MRITCMRGSGASEARLPRKTSNKPFFTVSVINENQIENDPADGKQTKCRAVKRCRECGFQRHSVNGQRNANREQKPDHGGEMNPDF